jgi:hypothetical protein
VQLPTLFGTEPLLI